MFFRDFWLDLCGKEKKGHYTSKRSTTDGLQIHLSELKDLYEVSSMEMTCQVNFLAFIWLPYTGKLRWKVCG